MKSLAYTMILLVGLGCSSNLEPENIKPINTMVVEYEPTTVVLFSYGWDNDPRIDDWGRLNPEHFVLTDLVEVEAGGQVKSRVTGKVYQCYLKKGDVLKVPTYHPENLDPISY